MEFRASLDQRSLDQTLRRLQAIGGRPGRTVLRKATAKVGSETLKQARAAAKRGRTGNFARSLAKKDKRYAKDGTYVSIVGQNTRRRSTERQIQRSRRRAGMLSRGLSGRGQQPAIHWIEAGTSPHTIRAKNRRRMYWTIGRGGQRISRRQAVQVRHPGHRGTGFLGRIEQRYRGSRINTFRREIDRGIVQIARQGSV